MRIPLVLVWQLLLTPTLHQDTKIALKQLNAVLSIQHELDDLLIELYATTDSDAQQLLTQAIQFLLIKRNQELELGLPLRSHFTTLAREHV